MSSLTKATEIAYFFIPLPEALALPEGFTLEVNSPETFDEHAERIRMADARGESAVDPPEAFLTASLKFWHGSVPGRDFDLLEQLFVTAQKALPGLPKPQHGQREHETTPVTVVEAAVPLSVGTDDPLSTAFDQAMRIIRGFQRAYYFVRKSPLKLITRQRLPAMIPYGVRTISEMADGWPRELHLLQLNWNVTPLARDATLTAAELDHLEFALDVQPGDRVFASYVDLRRDALRYFNSEGDYRATILFLAASAEVLFDDFLSYMLWEEGVRPEEAAPIFEVRLPARLRSYYHMRLGGAGWALDVPGALSQWNDAIARRRHRVIHAGYDPTYLEASRAVEALISLESFLGERLTSRKALGTYPRTALAFYGRPELERRGKWNQQLQALVDDPSETEWAPTFLRWNAAMQRARSDRPPGAVDPSVDKALVVAVVHPGQTLVWVLHDGEAHMARRAAPPYVITPEQSTLVARFVAARAVDAPAVSLALFDTRAKPLPEFTWVPEYRLLPLGGVMVTGVDLDRPEV